MGKYLNDVLKYILLFILEFELAWRSQGRGGGGGWGWGWGGGGAIFACHI